MINIDPPVPEELLNFDYESNMVEGVDYFPMSGGPVHAFYGKKHSEESKAIMREKKLGVSGKWLKGRTIPEEVKEKIRQTLKGKVQTQR